MRKINFPTVVTEGLKAGTVLASTLDPPAGEGITIEQMEIRLPIARKLQKANSHILLEDAEWAEIVLGIERTKWMRMDEDIFAVCKAALNAEEVKIKESK